MSEQNWYVYQNEQQTGPFDHEQLSKMLDSNMIAQEAFLFKVGWKDWVPLEKSGEALGRSDLALNENKRTMIDRAPRATIKGRVIVHNNGQLAIGSGVNISATGIFVETPEPIFKVGEDLKITCKVEGQSMNAFNVVAKVMRYNEDSKFPVGYGLKFVDLDETIAKNIQIIIDEKNLLMNGK